MPPRSGRGRSGLVVKRRKSSQGDERISAADVVAFIEEVCFVPEGQHVGKKLKLYDWQKREIERIYDNPVGTRRAILSFGRKNGKTTFAACLLLAHLCSKKQAELAAVLGSAIARSGRHHFRAGRKDWFG